MKKFVFCLTLFIVATNSFAYYDSYSYASSSTSAWLIIIGLLMFIWGVLEIILFFKIWGMTNDIRTIKKSYLHEEGEESYSQIAKNIRKNLVLGNIEHVKQILLTNFIDVVMRLHAQQSSSSYEENEKGETVYVPLEERNKQLSIAPCVEKLKQQFEKIGEPLPPYIAKMTTYGDFVNLFRKDDLVVKIERNE